MKRLLKPKLYSTLDLGKGFDRRIFLLDEHHNKISTWNDLPFIFEENGNNIINAVIEIPRYTLAKLEQRKNEPYHPIGQEVRTNRYNKNKIELMYWAYFPFFNYGFIPQTWESILIPNKEIDNLLGDDDALDIIEISDQVFSPCSVVPVRVFGIFALIDQGELDWKVVTLNKEEADQKKIYTLQDLNNHYPQRLEAIKRWFKYFKTSEGKKSNWIYYDDKTLDSDRAFEILYETHHQWKELREVGKNTQNYFDDYKRKLSQIAQAYYMN